MASEIERLQQVIDSAIGGSVTAKSDGTTHDIFPIAIHPREGEALSDWVAREGAASSIEIGFGYGVSTLFVFRGLLSNGSSAPFRHLTIDPNQIQGFASIGLSWLRKLACAIISTSTTIGRNSSFPAYWPRNVNSTSRSWTAITASTGYSST